MNRYLIDIDSDGKVYVRRTLIVTHDDILGEVIYHAMPMRKTPAELASTVRAVKREIALMRKHRKVTGNRRVT